MNNATRTAGVILGCAMLRIDGMVIAQVGGGIVAYNEVAI